MRNAIGVDIGGTKIEVVSIDEEGHVLQKIRQPIPETKQSDVVLREIVKAVEQLLPSLDTPPIGVGIGIAGQVEANTGFLYFAPNLNWRDLPLKNMLEESLHLPVFITNDVRAGAYGEWKYGAGKDDTDLVCLFIGTGIGGGIISGGRMIVGGNNSAGEFGHMVVDPHGPLCSCGNRGCLEAIAGGWAIAKSAEKADAKQVIEAYRRNDQKSQEVIEQVRKALVIGAINIVNLLNPNKLILGGGVCQSLPEIRDWLQEGVQRRALSSAAKNVQVIAGTSSCAIGAAAFLYQ